MTLLPSLPANPSTGSIERGGRLLRASIWLFMLVTIWNMGLYKPYLATGVDYDKHWFAARALLEGKSCYLAGTLWMGFNYPQAAAMPFVWLGFVSVKTGEALWKIMLFGLIAACGWMAWRQFKPVRLPNADSCEALDIARAGMGRHWGLVAALLTVSFYPATSAIYIGNIDPVNAFLSVAMVAALLSGAPLAAGVFWAMLTLIKMMPLMLIVPVLLWRQWRVLQGFLLVMGIYFVILLALGRVGEEWYFVREAMPAIPRWWRMISLAPVALFARWYQGGALMRDANTFAALAFWNELILLGAYMALNLAMFRRHLSWTCALEGAIVFYPLLSPLLEYHHFVWILPVLYLQARRWIEGGISTKVAVGLVLGWVALDSAFYIVDLWPTREGVFLHFASLPGYLLVLALTFYDLFQTPRNEGVPTRTSLSSAGSLPVG